VKYGIGLLVIGIPAWFLTAPDKPAPSSTKKTLISKSHNNSTDDQFTAEDMNAPHFQTVSIPVKNAFKPLVAKKSESAGSATANQVNAVPSDFAGGESTWLFTGTVVDNGKSEALLQSGPNGDGTYVSQGEHWKKSVVGPITANTLMLIGPGGVSKTLQLSFPEPPKETATPAASVGNAPLNPTITGPIGASAADATAATPDMTDPNGVNNTIIMGGNTGRRRGGRGGGGRGGGGRGGGRGGGGGGFGGFGG
jgi:hypothetical protein